MTYPQRKLTASDWIALDRYDAEPSAPQKAPSCCGMPMAYSGQSGWYCLKCGAGR